MNKSHEHHVRAIHRSIMHRCYCDRSNSYSRYGGRGIVVDRRWHDIDQFVLDMLPSYRLGLQIDRINNDLGYSVDNCRWKTRKQNCRNTCRSLSMTVNGVTRPLREWADISGIKFGTIYYRFTHGRSPSECISVGEMIRDRTSSANLAWQNRRRIYGPSGMKRAIA